MGLTQNDTRRGTVVGIQSGSKVGMVFGIKDCRNGGIFREQIPGGRHKGFVWGGVQGTLRAKRDDQFLLKKSVTCCRLI